MSHRWSFDPIDDYVSQPRRVYRPKKEKEPVWIAPEHMKAAAAMKKDYPRDNRGEAMKELGRRLVLDPRPTILIPDRPTIIGYL